jgi:hypothetical protein
MGDRHARPVFGGPEAGSGGSIALKLAMVVVGFALIAGGLLAVRQQRVQIASDLMRTHLETEQATQSILRLRAEIAAGETINQIRQMASSGTDLVPFAFVGASVPPPDAQGDQAEAPRE